MATQNGEERTCHRIVATCDSTAGCDAIDGGVDGGDLSPVDAEVRLEISSDRVEVRDLRIAHHLAGASAVANQLDDVTCSRAPVAVPIGGDGPRRAAADQHQARK